MSISYKLRRIKWAAKGLKESGFSDFRLIGLGFVKHFDTYNGYISFRAWAIPGRPLDEKPALVVEADGNRIFEEQIDWTFDPEACAYSKLDFSHMFGLKGFYRYRSNQQLNAFLEFKSLSSEYRLDLGTMPPTCSGSQVTSTVFNPWGDSQIGNITAGYHQHISNTIDPFIQLESNLDCSITVLVPVYNGFDYLDKLFHGLDKSRLPFNCLIIEDSSPDTRIRPKLQEIKSNLKHNCEIIFNDNNLGFVQTINKGLAKCPGHAVIVNTDTELPNEWLERLIAPILNDQSIASATPFTNSGTICSFPEFLENNEILFGMNVDEVDAHFQTIKPTYTEAPTGVGFCMAMSKTAIATVGLLDDATFGKGYGEENDWCQRAIKAGFKNVIVENLFVYHKHGGSFKSEEKQRLLDENLSKLNSKHPNYLKDVAEFCEQDPLKEIRSFIHAQIAVSQIDKPIEIIVTHLLGGGADAFANNKIEEILARESAAAVITYCLDDERYHVQIMTEPGELAFQYCSDDASALFSPFTKCDRIYINELATYPRMDSIIAEVISLAIRLKAEIITYIHDYLPICPNLNLLTKDQKYCQVPTNLGKCQSCYIKHGLHRSSMPESIERYREIWGRLLRESSKVVCFSKASEKILLRAHPNLINTFVEPHRTLHLPQIRMDSYSHDGIRIGILGNLTEHKGSSVLERLIGICNSEPTYAGQGISFILFGKNVAAVDSPRFYSYEEYVREELPIITQKCEIDVFVLLSIWPETFSFTCSEVIDMNVPAACFDIGAPAERIGSYSKGLLLPYPNDPKNISDNEASSLLDQICDHAAYWRNHAL